MFSIEKILLIRYYEVDSEDSNSTVQIDNKSLGLTQT